MSIYALLADVVVAVHVGYVGYVVLGQLLIIIGAGLGWAWVRNPWFRWTHLLAIAIVAVEAIMKWRCPLSIWEEQLRLLAGQDINSSETFLGRLFQQILFIHGMPESFFTTLYLAMFVIVLQGLIMCPPRGFRQANNSNSPMSLKPA